MGENVDRKGCLVGIPSRAQWIHSEQTGSNTAASSQEPLQLGNLPSHRGQAVFVHACVCVYVCVCVCVCVCVKYVKVFVKTLDLPKQSILIV